MDYEVTVKAVPMRLVAAAKQRTTFNKVSKEIQTLLNAPWAFLNKHPALRTDGHNVAIYWDESGDGSIEVGVQVIAKFDEADGVVCSATPAGTVARTSHFGPYHQLGAAHKAVRQWCKQNGRMHALPFWEVYGDWSDDPAKLQTDVLYLLK